MPFVHEKLMELLLKIVEDNDILYRISGDRMTAVIEKYALQELLTFERDPHNELAIKLVRDTLYGQSVKDVRFFLPNQQNFIERNRVPLF